MIPRVPSQKRSRAKYTAILQAALDLFQEKGYTETTIDAIVERSQLSVGVFYSYFSSKQQVLEALSEQETVSEENDIFSLPQQLLTLAETEALIWRFLRQRRTLVRALQELQLINPEFAQRERSLNKRSTIVLRESWNSCAEPALFARIRQAQPVPGCFLRRFLTWFCAQKIKANNRPLRRFILRPS